MYVLDKKSSVQRFCDLSLFRFWEGILQNSYVAAVPQFQYLEIIF